MNIGKTTSEMTIPGSNDNSVVFPFDTETNKYAFEFYFPSMTNNRLPKDELEQLIRQINQQCSKLSTPSSPGLLSRFMSCGGSKTKNKKPNTQFYYAELVKITDSLNLKLEKKQLRFEVPRESNADKYPRWLEIHILEEPTKENEIIFDTALLMKKSQSLNVDRYQSDVFDDGEGGGGTGERKKKRRPTRSDAFTLTDVEALNKIDG